MIAKLGILLALSIGSVQALYAESEHSVADDQFLTPHVVGTTSIESSTSPTQTGGRFLNVDENTQVQEKTTNNTTEDKSVARKKDATTRYDIYKDVNSWRNVFWEKLASISLVGNALLAAIHGTVTGDTQAPGLTLIAATEIGDTAAHIVWSSSLPGFSRVYYSSSTPVVLSASTSSITSWGMTSHDIELSELDPGTHYYYRIVSFSFSGSSTTSPEFSFVTKLK